MRLSMLYSGSLSKIPAPNQLLPIQTYVLLQKKVLQSTYAIMSLPVQVLVIWNTEHDN